jgi:hypothetical protein
LPASLRSAGHCRLISVLFAVSIGTAAEARGQDYVPPEDPRKDWYADLPLGRPEPRSEYGYPALDVDRRALAALVLGGSFEELEGLLSDLEQRTTSDIRWEEHLVEAYRAFERTDTTFADQLVRWTNARRESASAHFAAARAELLQIRRRRERGSLPPEPTETFAGEERLLRVGDNAYANLVRASQALERGRAVAPDAYMGFLLELEIAQQTGWSPRTPAILRDALARYPLSALLREQAAVNSVPGWGGTAEMARRIAADASELVPQNPRLVVLAGIEAADRARVRRLFRDNPGAMSAHAEALAAGTSAEFLLDRAGTHVMTHDYVRAVEDLNQALALRPQHPMALQLRGVALYEIAFHAPVERRAELMAAAVADYDLLVELDPGDATTADNRTFLSERADACAVYAETCLDGLEPSGPSFFGEGAGGALGVIGGFVRDFYTYFREVGLSPTWLSILMTFAGSFWLWRRSGYWLPGYVHVLALSALGVILFINWLWLRGGGEMWGRRWVVIAAFPITVYFVFITFGGLKAALGRRGEQQ